MHIAVTNCDKLDLKLTKKHFPAYNPESSNSLIWDSMNHLWYRMNYFNLMGLWQQKEVNRFHKEQPLSSWKLFDPL